MVSLGHALSSSRSRVLATIRSGEGEEILAAKGMYGIRIDGGRMILESLDYNSKNSCGDVSRLRFLFVLCTRSYVCAACRDDENEVRFDGPAFSVCTREDQTERRVGKLFSLELCWNQYFSR